MLLWPMYYQGENFPTKWHDWYIILQYLPLQDVVRTTILSKDWMYKWASIPQVEFTYNFFFEKCRNLEYLEVSSMSWQFFCCIVVQYMSLLFTSLNTSQLKLNCSIKGVYYYMKIKWFNFMSFQLINIYQTT